jgi:Flp pilus assembly protein TadG
MKQNIRPSSRKGFTTVYVTLTALVLIPVVGLAIDFSVLYNVKARLQAAVDAAAIGSGSMLERSTDLTNGTQVANIKDSAQRFFNANYPNRYWGSTQVYYDSTPSEDGSRTRTIYVHAAYDVPMLFLRVVGVSTSRVAAQASVKVRFVTLMIAVDRSGSVVNGGADSSIKSALNTFVANSSTSVFVDGRDYVGMVSFGGNWKLDYAPTLTFQSSTPNIGTAITNIPFDNSSSTNTSDGLWQAYYQLKQLNQTGSLNVIVLLTDGRPSAFPGQFTMDSSPCNATVKNGWLGANVGSSAADWPPPTVTGTFATFGINKTTWVSTGADKTPVANNAGCAFGSNPNNIQNDMSTFPNSVMPVDNPSVTPAVGPFSTITGVYPAPGNNTNSPRSVRYAAFNVADNIATTIRQDNSIRPVLFVIGLNESTGEPLDADWLARVANDPAYKDTNGNSVFQAGQTSGMYFNVSASGLSGAFQQIASQILRLSQ